MRNNDQHSTRNAERASSKDKKAKLLNQSDNPEIKPTKNNDEVLGAIEGVEKQLDALRGAHEEHRKLSADLVTRRARIDEAAEQVEARESELSTREVELAEMRQGLEDREAEILQRASGFEQRESQLAQHAKQIEGLEAVVESKGKQVDQRIDELDKQLEGISNRKDELANLEQQARDRIEQDSELESKLESLTNELDQARASLGGREIELKERAKVVEDLAIQASQLEKQIEQLNDNAHSEEADSLKVIEQMQNQLDTAQQKIGSHDEAMKRALDRIDELDKIASSQKHNLKKADGTAEELKSIKQSQTEATKQISMLESKLGQTDARLKAAATERDQIQSDLQAKLDQANELGKKGTKELKDSADALQSEIKDLKAKLSTENQRVSEFQSKHEQLEKQLATEQSTVAELNTQAEESQNNIDQLEKLLTHAKEHGQQLTDQVHELTEALETEQEQNAGQSSEWTTIRRERLATTKLLLRVQSDKIHRATEALRDRYDQCEKVLHKRSELVDAYQAVTDAQTKLAKRESKSGALMGLSGLGLVLMMIAAVSWFVAGQVTPGLYSSQVTIVANAGERTLTDDDLVSWQTYIEQLATDPQFIEKAAQRMKQRGITELSIPGTLASHMSESLDVFSAQPGTINLEYRGNGSASTQRVLETYSLALTSQANAARARRIDGALTFMSENASLGGAPLDATRIETAGMIFGGSSLATFMLGGIFWRRLAKVKANFERDTRVVPLFDEDSWHADGSMA